MVLYSIPGLNPQEWLLFQNKGKDSVIKCIEMAISQDQANMMLNQPLIKKEYISTTGIGTAEPQFFLKLLVLIILIKA